MNVDQGVGCLVDRYGALGIVGTARLLRVATATFSPHVGAKQ